MSGQHVELHRHAHVDLDQPCVEERDYQATSSRYRPHRVAWEREKGLVPSGMVVHHECRNKKCVNVAHLMLLTNAEHSALHLAERVAENGGTIGQRHGPNTSEWKERLRTATQKLSDDQVREIRARLARGELGYKIAAAFGVCHSTITNIKSGKNYKEVI